MDRASATSDENPMMSTMGTESPPPPAPATTANVVTMPSSPPKSILFIRSPAFE